MRKSRAEGLADGLAMGKKDGLRAGKLAIALELKKRSLSTEDISSITGLSITEIEKL